MGKIFKSSDLNTHGLTPVIRETLEEFPEKTATQYQLPPRLDEDTSPEGIEEAEEIDPEAIREAVFQEAREEAERMVQEAYTEGLARGEERGEAAFQETTAHCAEMLEAAADRIAEVRAAFLETLTPQVVELVELMCRRVFLREMQTDPELLHRTVRQALSKIADRQKITVHIHPDDLEALKQHRISLLEDFNGVEELDLESDEGITPGGCMVDSQTMHIDARLETLLSNILDALRE